MHRMPGRLGMLLLLALPASAGGATYVVTNTNNSGAGSLRDAIEQANATPGIADRIEFNIPGAGVHTISPQGQLPIITDAVVIDGYSQPGASVNTLAVGNDAVLRIEIDGTNVGGERGLSLQGGGSTVRGLILNRLPGSSGVIVESSGNLIEGNFIGTDASGTIALGNVLGVNVQSGANSVIGGTTPAARNLISGHIAGISNFGTNTVIQGNYIGTDKTGGAALPNRDAGIGDFGSGTLIGGTAPGAGNLISGNTGYGIQASGVGAVISGNRIGTNASGSGPLGNTSHGVVIFTNPGLPPPNGNVVGGTAASVGNLIAYNGGAGVRISDGEGHAVLGNEIFANAGLGIDLGPAGVTANDPGDSDSGPNGLQNFPVLTGAHSAAGSTTVEGTLGSLPITAFRLEFFANGTCDPSDFGEGRSFLGFGSVVTDGSGNASFSVLLPGQPGPRHRISATATDPLGNTSEFSACISQLSSFFTVTPCRAVDTRLPAGPHGGPPLAPGADRVFTLAGECGIPATARSVAANLTVTGSAAGGHLTAYPGGTTLPPVSTLNYRPGQTRANNAILSLGELGDLAVHCEQVSGSVHLIIDLVGYFE